MNVFDGAVAPSRIHERVGEDAGWVAFRFAPHARDPSGIGRWTTRTWACRRA